jgi:hypothetical protein
VLAAPPTPIAIAPTPAPALRARGCVPAGATVSPSRATLAGTTLSYCLGASNGNTDTDPYCFTADVVTRAVTPVPPPIDVLSSRAEPTSADHATIERADASVKVCMPDGTCRELAIPHAAGPTAVVSEDGAIATVGDVDTGEVETWDVATGKRIARFHVRFPERNPQRELDMWSHDVLAINKPCAGPCATARIYTAAGRDLGLMAAEAGGVDGRFHDDLWIITNPGGGFVVQDATTGKVLTRQDTPSDSTFVVTPERFAVVLTGEHPGEVHVYDARARLVATIPQPTCGADSSYSPR